MDLLESKLLACVTLGFGSVFFGLIPACFTNTSRNQSPLLLSCLLCFGGGVLFATSITHMLPENRAKLGPYQEYAEIIFCLGFFILYIIDEIVHFFYGETNSILTIPNKKNAHNHYGSVAASERTAIWQEPQLPYNPAFYKSKSESHLIFENSAPSQLCHVGHQEPCISTAPTINFGLVVALTVHSVLEGLVVGLENTTSKVILLLGAIASHKLVVGFCLGLELASNTTFCRHFMGILVFAAGSVIGIAIGAFATIEESGNSDTILAFLQGLAGGTLLYVTLSEILPRERARWHQQHHKRGAGIYQFISTGFGFVMMTIMGKYLDAD